MPSNCLGPYHLFRNSPNKLCSPLQDPSLLINQLGGKRPLATLKLGAQCLQEQLQQSSKFGCKGSPQYCGGAPCVAERSDVLSLLEEARQHIPASPPVRWDHVIARVTGTSLPGLAPEFCALLHTPSFCHCCNWKGRTPRP